MFQSNAPAHPKTVAGEDVRVLVEALLPLFEKQRKTGRGVYIGGLIGGSSGEALMRALLRVEAELMLADADRLGPGDLSRMRSHDARRADALLELVNRMSPDQPGGRSEGPPPRCRAGSDSI